MPVSENLRNLRKKKKLTQQELARISGVSQQAISFLENGRNTPNHGTLELLAEALDCTVSELTGEAPESDGTITNAERRLLRAWRAAEDAARRMALDLLESHPAEIKNEIRA